MSQELIEQLKASLATSDATNRKFWAQWIINDQIPLQSLMSLLHFGDGTSQRFMWLIGDICELDPESVRPCLPMLFSLRNEMPFPGMPRSVAKWLWLTNVPVEMEAESVSQLFAWMESESASIACKSYAAKALFDLATDRRISSRRFVRCLEKEAEHENRAYGKRIRKILNGFPGDNFYTN
ncbi:MAG: hypothetical protein AAF456_02590 [Planctomycetota bacterium]